jgi:hypothetical protein
MMTGCVTGHRLPVDRLPEPQEAPLLGRSHRWTEELTGRLRQLQQGFKVTGGAGQSDVAHRLTADPEMGKAPPKVVGAQHDAGRNAVQRAVTNLR